MDKTLTLQYIPRSEVMGLDTDDKIKMLLNSVKENKILIVEGKLNSFEEAELIRMTMEAVDRKFKGVEICSVDSLGKYNASSKFRHYLAGLLLGESMGVSIIGPANIIKEIKNNPDKIELFMNDTKSKKYRKKK